ncbi:MAG: PIG-L family deacetylase [Herminiimonas sp.]|nr:PIG-L family deacetylase [Herminiimonas sp.]
MHLAISAADLLVISPHLDDAVFGCGEVIAAHPGALVVTLFAGTPDDGDMRTSWDRAAGFASAQQAMVARRREDRTALACLEARPLWLDFIGAQYQRDSNVNLMASRLVQVVRSADPACILLPAGLVHDDHAAAHAAALIAMKTLQRSVVPVERDWLMYEEPAYRRLPGLLQERLSCLSSAGVEATPARMPRAHAGRASDGQASAAGARKHVALQCYESQLRALRTAARAGLHDLYAPEAFWRLSAT